MVLFFVDRNEGSGGWKLMPTYFRTEIFVYTHSILNQHYSPKPDKKPVSMNEITLDFSEDYIVDHLIRSLPL